MRNIIYFIINNATTLYFILLELVCAILVVNFNDYQRSAFMSSSNTVCGAFYSVRSSVSKYLSFGDENQKLSLENSELKTRIEQLEEALSHVGDSLRTVLISNAEGEGTRYVYHTAHVINSTTNRSRNFLTLDAGRRDGIEPDMIVTSAGCVVGLVTAASDHYATVLPIINNSFHLSVKIEESNHRGQLIWEGTSAQRATLIDVPEHAKVSVGDHVVTSGSSSYFPEGMTVGEIEEVEMDRSGGFFHLTIKIAADYNSVYDVEVIECAHRDELKELEAQRDE